MLTKNPRALSLETLRITCLCYFFKQISLKLTLLSTTQNINSRTVQNRTPPQRIFRTKRENRSIRLKRLQPPQTRAKRARSTSQSTLRFFFWRESPKKIDAHLPIIVARNAAPETLLIYIYIPLPLVQFQTSPSDSLAPMGDSAWGSA